VWQVAYFLEAAFLADRMHACGVEHLHNHIGESSATVAMLASELSGIPYSLTIHGPYIFRAPERWALGEKLVRAAFTACISEFTRSQCMIYVPQEHWSRLHVIRCGPDPQFLEQEPPELPDNRRLIWVGRLCEEKAVPLLVDAAQRLVEENVDFQLVLVGDGPLREITEAQIEERGLKDAMSIAGWMDSEQVREQIAGSRAMLMPSFAEGLPVVLMEALALARPVISTFIAGVPELVEPGVNGWLIPAGSLDHLVSAIREALDLPLDRLKEMGRAGRQAVLRYHDPGVEVARLEEQIERSINSRTQAAPR
jgi:glycosyltransferase involved in cell wall biosynthesis